MPARLRLSRASLRPRPEALLVAFVIVAGACVGALSIQSAKLAVLALSALLGFAAVARRPVILAIIAVAGTFVTQRVGGSSFSPGSGGGISYSDVLVTAAFLMAVPALAGTDELRRLRFAGVGVVAYLTCLLPSVISNPSTAADLEWVHRFMLVAGAMIVGAWLVQEKAVQPALRLLTGLSCVMALFAVQYTVVHNFQAAYPLGLHKNHVGGLFGLVILILLLVPERVNLPRRLHWSAVGLVAVGLFAAQSRGGMLAAAFGLLLAFFFGGRVHSVRTKIVAIVVAASFATFAYLSVNDQLNQTQQEVTNSSIGVRFNVEEVTRDIWRTSPIVGVGLKYFNTGNYGEFAYPANVVIDNELAESGLVGAAGFIVLQGVVLTALFRRRRTSIGLAGLAVASGQLLHGMVDIYWVAGPVTLSFLLAGMALAEPASKEASEPGEPRIVAAAA